MDLETIFALFIILGFPYLMFLGIPAFLSWVLYKTIKKRSPNKKLRWLAIIPLLVSAYYIFFAIFPEDSFFQRDFKEITGVTFPESGKIIHKSASWPDHFGDYTSVAIITVDKKFYDNLPDKLRQSGFDQVERIGMGSNTLEEILSEAERNSIEKHFSREISGGAYYYVGFYSDNKTLLSYRVSW